MDARLALPPDDELTADLTTPRFEVRTGGKIHVEEKDEIRKRLGRSTDFADAVVQACWIERYEREYSNDRRVAMEPLARIDAYRDPDQSTFEDADRAAMVGMLAIDRRHVTDPEETSFVYAEASQWLDDDLRFRDPLADERF